MANRQAIGVCVVLGLLNSGCATAAGSSDPLRSTVYATHRMVQELNQNLSGTMSRLSDTTAELSARLNSSEQQMRVLMSMTEENQYKLEQLQRSLDSLTASLYRQLNLSPPEVVSPAPTRPFPNRPGFDRGNIIVEPPTAAPQPDTGIFQTPPPRTTFDPGTETTVAPGADEDAHYRLAQELYGDDNYVEALRQFEEHLAQFPNSKHAANASYWRAHCHFKMGDYAEAIAGFEKLRTEFPDSGKVPIAMHNQAVAYSRLDQNERAIQLFQRLIREYPDDVATEGARDKLRQLQLLN